MLSCDSWLDNCWLIDGDFLGVSSSSGQGQSVISCPPKPLQGADNTGPCPYKDAINTIFSKVTVLCCSGEAASVFLCVCRSAFGVGEIGSSRKTPVLALGWTKEPSLHCPYPKSPRFPQSQASGSESHSVCRRIRSPARASGTVPQEEPRLEQPPDAGAASGSNEVPPPSRTPAPAAGDAPGPRLRASSLRLVPSQGGAVRRCG